MEPKVNAAASIYRKQHAFPCGTVISSGALLDQRSRLQLLMPRQDLQITQNRLVFHGSLRQDVRRSISDHVIEGHLLFPGVAFLELASATDSFIRPIDFTSVVFT